MPLIPVHVFARDIDAFIRRNEPGASDAIFPRFIEENAIFTHAAFPTGVMWRAGTMNSANFSSALSVISTVDSLVPSRALRYYQAISGLHTDPIARDLTLEIFDVNNGIAVAIAEFVGLPQNQFLAVPRPIVIGENFNIRVRVDAIAVDARVTLRTYSMQQSLGGDLPGL